MRGSRYGYDQLNRLIASNSFNSIVPNNVGQNEAGPSDGRYNELFSYDANGNILTLDRNGNSTSALAMDELDYTYYPGTNQLRQVTDQVLAGDYVYPVEDLETQGSNNFTYDAIGNLKKDVSANQKYTWYTNGKLKSVTQYETVFEGDPAWKLDFVYDPMGNRIEKRHTSYTSGFPQEVKSTYYVRDAQGNVLSTYTRENNDLYKQEELTMYGSSRLGVINTDKLLYSQATGTIAPGFNPVNHYLGKKQFELSNHLGNVMATVSDQPNGINTDLNPDNEYYEPVLRSGQDYYAFGSLKPGRTLSSAEYKFGFNGQEKTDEIAGAGNHTTAEFWEYDTRLGRRWNVDPITYPWQSSYVVNNANPIAFTDPLGLFGSRKEAREYKREHGIKGRINQDSDGIYNIQDRKNNVNYHRDRSVDDIPMAARQADGVIKSNGTSGYDESKDAQNGGGTDWGAIGNAAFYTEYGLGAIGWTASTSANSGFKYAYRGMAQAEAVSIKTLSKITKTTRVLGTGAAFVGGGAAVLEFAYSKKSGSDIARLGGAALITGTAFIPIVGLPLSIGLGVLDSYDVFDPMYDSFGSQPLNLVRP